MLSCSWITRGNPRNCIVGLSSLNALGCMSDALDLGPVVSVTRAPDFKFRSSLEPYRGGGVLVLFATLMPCSEFYPASKAIVYNTLALTRSAVGCLQKPHNHTPVEDPATVADSRNFYVFCATICIVLLAYFWLTSVKSVISLHPLLTWHTKRLCHQVPLPSPHYSTC